MTGYTYEEALESPEKFETYTMQSVYSAETDKLKQEITELKSELEKAVTELSCVKAERDTAMKYMPRNNVNHPAHYNIGGVECIDAIKAATSGLNGFEGFCIGNAIKYLWRWKNKGGKEDLQKAEWYIEKLTEDEEKGRK